MKGLVSRGERTWHCAPVCPPWLPIGQFSLLSWVVAMAFCFEESQQIHEQPVVWCCEGSHFVLCQVTWCVTEEEEEQQHVSSSPSIILPPPPSCLLIVCVCGGCACVCVRSQPVSLLPLHPVISLPHGEDLMDSVPQRERDAHLQRESLTCLCVSSFAWRCLGRGERDSWCVLRSL